MEGRNTFHFWWHFLGCYVKFDGGHHGHCTNVWRRFVRKGLADFAWKSNGGPFSQKGSSEEQVVGNCLSQPPTKSMNSVFSTMPVFMSYFCLKSLQFDFLFGSFWVLWCSFLCTNIFAVPKRVPSDSRRRISVFGHAEGTRSLHGVTLRDAQHAASPGTFGWHRTKTVQHGFFIEFVVVDTVIDP